MFGWNFARSAEAMFSRWAIKRVCKFLLKKKLGQLILGDIDLDHLDVQLTKGSVQLSDLALNVDFLNQKFGDDASVFIKEGSIGSLLVTMPWKGKGCEVEVEELELVLAPCSMLDHQFGSESCTSRHDTKHGDNHDGGNREHEKTDNAKMSASVDVREGVKTIAKMVKWLLTSFHVKVKKLIVAFDSLLLEHEKSMELQRTLVLRITEVECGTCISEEVSSDANTAASNFLGLNLLTNFVKFEGAVLEFLHMDGEINDALFSGAQEESFDKLFSACCPSRARTPVLSGERGGVSGTLKLSIPWKNGSLDIRKVEADAYIDPIELKFQPNSIKWFLCLWDIVNNVGKNSKTDADNTSMGSVYYNSTSRFYSSLLGSLTSSDYKSLPRNERSSASWSPAGVPDALLPESKLISDWVPFVTNNTTQKDGTEAEPDFGPSVEQFFECFDGMRSSQSALGNSGMWNWTCSVFSVITAASSLASGSLQVPCEQQHVETNFKATIGGISIRFSLIDGDQQNSSSRKRDTGSYAHYLISNFQDMHLVLQVCPRERNFKATVKSMDLTDCYTYDNDETESGLGYRSGVEGQMRIIQQIQDSVECSLPPFSSAVRDSSLKKPNANCKCIYRDDVVKVILFRTSGATQFQVTVKDGSPSNNFVGPISFSLKMPPFVFWVNFCLINMVVSLLKEIGNSFEPAKDVSVPKDFSSKNFPSSSEEVKSSPVSRNGCLTGDMFLPTARIIMCFPSVKGDDSRNYSSLDQFIILDISSPSPLSGGNAHFTTPVSNASPYRGNSLETSRSLSLNMGNLDTYLLTPASFNNGKLAAVKFLSARSKRGHFSVISLHWQEGSVTGPWMVKRAELLATDEDSEGRSRCVGKGYEFASVTTAKDVEETSNRTRKDMILSSSFFLHAYLSPIRINLSDAQYKTLHSLLLQVLDELEMNNAVKNNSVVFQTSFLFECDSAEICVCPEMEKSVKGSIEKELPGSWDFFRLQIRKFQLLSVSNIGGICGANFLWAAHGEGNLWGSITGVPDRQLLLISCSNTVMGRGDGEGSNVLSSKFAGSDIIRLLNPESSLDYMSINIRCCSIVAIGGRLDWLERVSSFFSLPSSETEQANDHGTKEGTSVEDVACQSSFVFNLVDVGLSYEPHIKDSLTHELFISEFSSMKADEGINIPYIACLLAASSAKLSYSKKGDDVDTEYKIVVQDIGLLLCTISGAEKISDIYSAEHLHKVGYVKVAQDPRIRAIFKIFLDGEPTWELECSESHIDVETCHDTTSGLIRLGSQLQQLFAPDLEESYVHLQTRWNNNQKGQQNDGMSSYSSDSAPSSHLGMSHPDIRIEPGGVNFMDEICENEFHFDTCVGTPSSSSESDFHIPTGETLSASENDQSLLFQESFIEFVEGYFLTEVSPMSELPVENQSSNTVLKNKSWSKEEVDAKRINSGWYGDSSLKIMDDHVSDVVAHTGPRKVVSDEATTSNCNKLDENGKVKGRVNFKNINICWKMYEGSDWYMFQNDALHSSSARARDRTTCLELVFSGAELNYVMYPEGEICVSRLSLSVEDFLLNDNSHEAPWKLVLGYYQSKDCPRKSCSKAFKLDLESVRPDPLTPLEEYRLQIAFLPMILHLHQSQLDFLISFFGAKAGHQASNTPQDLTKLDVSSKDGSTCWVHSISEEALLPYFQKFDIWPVFIRVDYIPSRVDLAALKVGKYVELMNLVPWKGVELKLKHVQTVGVYGLGSVCETIIGDWLEDISQNQVHKLLRGLPPIRSLMAVGSGAAKLVTLPVESYKKEHKVLKGMQRGMTAFLRSISLEAVGLGVHLAAGAHDVLLQAEYVLTSTRPSVREVQRRTKMNVRSNQPENARQGVKQAYESISDGLGKSASALVRSPVIKYQRSGAGSALTDAIQAAPAAAIAPASATARAVHYALLGMRNSLDPDRKKESIEKYLGSTQYREKFSEN